VKFIVNGGKKLKGEIDVRGSKNAATPLIAATLLTKRPCVIKNVPLISDVLNQIKLLEEMGAEIEWLGKRSVKIINKKIDNLHIPRTLVRQMRSSILLIGPLLARFGEVRINTPGGCHIGTRSMDAHFDAFRQLGFEIKYNKKQDIYHLKKGNKKSPQKIALNEFSVTATENLLMFSALHPFEIEIAAAEPHIQCLGDFLIKLGAKIDGLGTHTIKVKKSINKSGGEVIQNVISDYIEAGTLMVMGAATGSDIKINNVPVKHLILPMLKLREFGVKMSIKGNSVLIKGSQSKLKAVKKIMVQPYPGFPADLQAPFGVLATQAEGETLIFDTLYEGRLKYLYELDKMGAKVNIMGPHQATITGPRKLIGKNVESIDLRAGATLIIAALVAKGESILHQAEQIDRGYEMFEERLSKIGADIKRE